MKSAVARARVLLYGVLIRSIAKELRAVVVLYRAAQHMRSDDFAAHAFTWLRERISFDRAFITTSLKSEPGWVDAHFTGFGDPRALMESYSKVRDLDVLSARMMSNPSRAHRIDVDDSRIARPRFAPFREHCRRFGGAHMLGIAIPIGDGDMSSVFMLARAKAGRRFKDVEIELLEAFAPHFAEAAAVNRLRWLQSDGASEVDALPIALLGPDGRFLQTTPAFVRLFCPDVSPASAYLPESMFAVLSRGRAWPLPDQKHSLYAQADDSGGWLLRIRTSGRLDLLSPRQRQIAALFARYVQHKDIAKILGIGPNTVRNHLQTIYDKLDVNSRDELIELLARP